MRLLVLTSLLLAVIFTAAPAVSQIAQQNGNRFFKDVSPAEAYKQNPDRYILERDNPYIAQDKGSMTIERFNPYGVDTCPKSTCRCKGGGCDRGCCVIRP